MMPERLRAAPGLLPAARRLVLALAESPSWCLAALLAAAAAAAIQKHIAAGDEGLAVYHIYANSFRNLCDGKDLYARSPGLDYFLYTPAFPVLMAPFAWLPDALGCVLWSMLNVAVYFAAIWLFPFDAAWKRLLALAFSMPLVVSNIQNFQSNILVAGLLVLVFVAFERGASGAAAAAVAAAAFVKVYGAGFAVLAAFHPRKLPAFAARLAAWCAALSLLPLPFVGLDAGRLLFLWRRWLESLSLDTGSDINLMGVMRTCLGVDAPPAYFQAASLAAMAVPLLFRRARGCVRFRAVYLSTLLLWVVVFSHKAESPSYVVAATGVALWLATGPLAAWRAALAALVFIGAELVVTDLAPGWFRRGVVRAYGIQAIPCALAWAACVAELYAAGLRPPPKERPLGKGAAEELEFKGACVVASGSPRAGQEPD